MRRWRTKDKRRACPFLVHRCIALWTIPIPSSVSSTVPMMRSCACLLRLGVESSKKFKEHKSGRNLTPVEDVDIEFEVRCAEALEHLIQAQAKLTQLPVSLVINRISSKA